MPIQTAKQARNLAAIALSISLLANLGVMHQAHRNCRAIEENRSALRMTVHDSFVRLNSGALDGVYKKVYNGQWIEQKQEDLNRLIAEEHRFDSRTCNYIFR